LSTVARFAAIASGVSSVAEVLLLDGGDPPRVARRLDVMRDLRRLPRQLVGLDHEPLVE
jgi:hypothetical protein